MRIEARYSHLNGWEFLKVHRPALWDEVEEVIQSVDAEACKTKVSRERTMPGRRLYSPVDMNTRFSEGLASRGWRERRNTGDVLRRPVLRARFVERDSPRTWGARGSLGPRWGCALMHAPYSPV